MKAFKAKGGDVSWHIHDERSLLGLQMGYSAPTKAAIREDLNLSLAEYSMFGSILTIRAMFEAISSSRISDFIDQKGTMRLSARFCITGWLIVCFSMVPVFIAEIAPKNLRGGLTTHNQLMIVSGSSIAFLLGTVVTLMLDINAAHCFLTRNGLDPI